MCPYERLHSCIIYTVQKIPNKYTFNVRDGEQDQSEVNVCFQQSESEFVGFSSKSVFVFPC